MSLLNLVLIGVGIWTVLLVICIAVGRKLSKSTKVGSQIFKTNPTDYSLGFDGFKHLQERNDLLYTHSTFEEEVYGPGNTMSVFSDWYNRE